MKIPPCKLQHQTCYFLLLQSKEQGSSHHATTASIIKFNWSKRVMERGMTSFTSYSTTRWITLPCPTKLSTTHRDLKQGSNIKANILWTWQKSNAFKNSRKRLNTFTTSYYMFFFNVWSSTSKRSNVSLPSRGSISNSIATIKFIAIIKASNRN